MQKLFEFVQHIGDWKVLVHCDDIAPHAIHTRHIADNTVTPAKLSPECFIPTNGSIMFWIEHEEGTGKLFACYASESCIKDFRQDPDTGAMYVYLSTDPTPPSPDDWQNLSFHEYVDRRVVVAANLENEVCPVDLQEGGECTVLYDNNSPTEAFTIGISPRYKTADGQVVSLTVPAGGYAEVSYLKSGGEIYVRGV